MIEKKKKVRGGISPAAQKGQGREIMQKKICCALNINVQIPKEGVLASLDFPPFCPVLSNSSQKMKVLLSCNNQHELLKSKQIIESSSM